MPNLLFSKLTKKIIFFSFIFSLFSNLSYGADSTGAASGVINPNNSTRIPLRNYVLASGTVIGTNTASGNHAASSAVVQLLITTPTCVAGTTPWITLSPVSQVHNWIRIDGIYVYPINPWAWTGHPTLPVTQTGCCYNEANSGRYISSWTTNGYYVYYRNEILSNGEWWANWLDVNWVVYCLVDSTRATWAAGDAP